MMLPSILRPTSIIYWALLAGQLIFALVVLYLSSTLSRPEAILPDVSLLSVACLLGTSGVAWFLNRLRSQQGAQLDRANLAGKAAHYRTSVLLRSAIIEAGNFLVLTFALLTFDLLVLVYFALGIGLFLHFRPSLSEFTSIYQLSGQELAQLTST